MPTFPVYRYRVVTNFGDFNTSTSEEPMEGDVDGWMKAYQDHMNKLFAEKAAGAPVKVTAIFRVVSGNEDRKIWG